MTKKEATIISAYTGVLVCGYSELKSYAEGLLGHPLFDATMRDPAIIAEIKLKAKPDFMALEVED